MRTLGPWAGGVGGQGFLGPLTVVALPPSEQCLPALRLGDPLALPACGSPPEAPLPAPAWPGVFCLCWDPPSAQKVQTLLLSLRSTVKVFVHTSIPIRGDPSSPSRRPTRHWRPHWP